MSKVDPCLDLKKFLRAQVIKTRTEDGRAIGRLELTMVANGHCNQTLIVTRLVSNTCGQNQFNVSDQTNLF